MQVGRLCVAVKESAQLSLRMSQGLQWEVQLLNLVLYLTLTITQTRGTREQAPSADPKCFSEGALVKGQQATGREEPERNRISSTSPSLPTTYSQLSKKRQLTTCSNGDKW